MLLPDSNTLGPYIKPLGEWGDAMSNSGWHYIFLSDLESARGRLAQACRALYSRLSSRVYGVVSGVISEVAERPQVCAFFRRYMRTVIHGMLESTFDSLIYRLMAFILVLDAHSDSEETGRPIHSLYDEPDDLGDIGLEGLDINDDYYDNDDCF